MGKRIIQQRRGRGTHTYKAHSYRWGIKVKHRQYDDLEKKSMIKGKIIDLVHKKGFMAPIAFIKYEDNEILPIFAPEGVKVNDEVFSGKRAEIKIGNTLPLANIPDGTLIYNLEIVPGDGGKISRSPGLSSRVISKLGSECLVELPSKKKKRLDARCRATIGLITGRGRTEKPLVKAGKVHHIMRARGKLYPRTSGVAMNAVDHPFGSGRGRHHSKIKPPPRFAPPGRNVGPIHAKHTGRSRKLKSRK